MIMDGGDNDGDAMIPAAIKHAFFSVIDDYDSIPSVFEDTDTQIAVPR